MVGKPQEDVKHAGMQPHPGHTGGAKPSLAPETDQTRQHPPGEHGPCKDQGHVPNAAAQGRSRAGVPTVGAWPPHPVSGSETANQSHIGLLERRTAKA